MIGVAGNREVASSAKGNGRGETATELAVAELAEDPMKTARAAVAAALVLCGGVAPKTHIEMERCAGSAPAAARANP